MAKTERFYMWPEDPSDVRSDKELSMYAKRDEKFYYRNFAGDIKTFGGGDIAWADVGDALSIIAGHVIQDEGFALTNRSVLNFTGDGVTAYDDGSGKTIVDIAGPGTPGIQFGTENSGSWLHITTTTNHFLGSNIVIADNYGSTDSHGISISSNWGAVEIAAGLQLDLIATDRGGSDHARGLLSLLAISEGLSTGLKFWIEHAGNSGSLFGGNNHIVIARVTGYSDVPGDVLMRIECDADGSNVKYRIKADHTWVADL